MKSSDFIGFQWTDYEGLPMEDRFRIVETYFNKGRNLFESNNKLAVDRFNNLYHYAVSQPVPSKKYIMVLLALINNEVIVSQETQIVEYLSKHDNYYVVRLQDGREAEFPHKHIRDKLLMSIFLFDDIKNYERFNLDLIMMFDRGLPEFNQEDVMEDYQQFIPPKKMVWMVAFTPVEDVKKQSATNRQTVRYFYKDEETALLDSQRLKRAGHDVYTPVEVSAKNMNPNDKLREAMNPANNTPSGSTTTVYFVREKRNGKWVRIAKYSYPLKAESAMHDLQDSYEANGQTPPELDIEQVDNHPKTMYENNSEYTHNPVGLKNWRELERAVKYKSSNIDDPLHMARLNFGGQIIPLPKGGDMARLYKWVKNKLGNNKQREVFELLASPQLLNHLVTSSRPPKGKLDEGKKRKSQRKTKELPRVYGGWWGYGNDSGGGDGGGVEEAAEQDIKGAPKDTSKDVPKVELPPAHHAQKTQIPGTLPTYQKAFAMLNDWAPQGTTLDFGAGLGIGAKFMGSDTFEPFPKTGFNPTYTDSGSIKSGSYNRMTNLNVLNVVPKDTRDGIVTEIGRILAPGGVAVITTRGKDVMSAKGEKGPEPMSIITSIGTYQKGFTKAELKGYIEGLLGKGFEVESINLGPAGVAIRKLAKPMRTRKEK
jgi:hypothetical protein